MRFAAIYDIHGNLPALEAVLADIHRVGVDALVVGGDVLPGPMPSECLDCLRRLTIPVHYLRGNGEREVLALSAGVDTGTVPARFRDVMQWVADQLDPEQVRWLSEWPATLDFTVPGLGDVLFCHATPRNDVEIFVRTTPAERLGPVFEGVKASLVVCGHTHMQFDRLVGGVRVVNAGSVGMPFGEPGAYWLLLGPGLQLQRTDYPLAEAAARVRGTRYPQADDFATRNILQPPTEQEMSDLFGRSELR